MEESSSGFQKRDVDFTPTPESQEYCEQGKKLKKAGKLQEANLSLIQSIQIDRQNTEAYEILSDLYASLDHTESLEIIRAEKERIEGNYKQSRSVKGHYETTLFDLMDIGGNNPKPKNILIVTNLFPPQEMGGFGKTMWEFTHGLLEKGHSVLVLTSNSKYLHKNPSAGTPNIESVVQRELQLFGHWETGTATIESDESKIRSIVEHNVLSIRKWIQRFNPDVSIVGNIDLLGHPFIFELIARGIPVIHRLGNRAPGYPTDQTPQSPLYCMAPCSEWLKNTLLADGYPIQKFEVLYPGSPLEQYYRFISPDLSTLRIVYASIIAPFKGLDILVKALGKLKKANVSFECHVLGNATDIEYMRRIRRICKTYSIEDNIQFYGYQSRKATARIFDKCNTLVFPSTFEEPFGKTLIEAMASGMTVVCSGTGGSKEIIQDSENGVIFKNKDSNDLAEKLYSLAINKDRAFELAQAGQQSCLKFSSARSIQKLDSIIEQMSK